MNFSGSDKAGIWPTPQQELLLRAALHQTEAGLTAWRAWRDQADPTNLDAGTIRLLPLVYANLRRLGEKDSVWHAKLQGCYRFTRARNQFIFHQASLLLDALHAVGCETLLLKGAPLATLYYRDEGLRPMADIDVLVSPQAAPQAVELLQKQNWTALRPEGVALIPFTNALAWRSPAGLEADLHWNVMFGCWRAYDDATLWAAAMPFDFQGRRTKALCATDQLLHTCFHGARWNTVPPLRWIADAWLILQRSEVNQEAKLDWARLLELARERYLTLMLRETLGYLHDKLAAPVPSEVLAKLRAAHVSRWEANSYADKLRPQKALTAAGWLRYWRYAYVHVTRRTPARPRWLTYARALQKIWCVPHLWQLPVQAAGFAVRRTGRALNQDPWRLAE